MKVKQSNPKQTASCVNSHPTELISHALLCSICSCHRVLLTLPWICPAQAHRHDFALSFLSAWNNQIIWTPPSLRSLLTFSTQRLFTWTLFPGVVLAPSNSFPCLFSDIAFISICKCMRGFPSGSVVKRIHLPVQGDERDEGGSMLGPRRSLGAGNGNPLHYSCLENPMDRGAWGATVHGVAKR